MSGKYKKAKVGQPVYIRKQPVPFTFWPDAYLERGRLVTSAPWACLMAHIQQKVNNTSKRKLAMAFLEQAQDFFHSAMNTPRMGSKPLLYYYCFLNLAKVLLTINTNLDLKKCIHGLSEPKENIRIKLKLASQNVRVSESKQNTVQVYREFIKECGFPEIAKPKPIKVIDLLEQIVGIHRITSHALKRDRQYFPISEISFEYAPQSKETWISLYINKDEVGRAASQIRMNTTSFKEVKSPKNGYRRYESEPMNYGWSPIEVLRPLVIKTWKDIWSELRPGGYKFWFSSITKQKRRAQLASGFMAMFYFGSIARYRPDDFYKIIEGKHGWMVQEFINTQPLQFIYFLGSGIVNAEMVIPELM